MDSKNTFEQLDTIVPWFHMDEKNVIFNTNGSLQITLKYKGVDHVSMEDYQLASYMKGLNNIFKRLDTGVIIYVENQRNTLDSYFQNQFPTPFMTILEKERKDFFENHFFYENEYHITYIKKLPTDLFSSFENVFTESGKPASSFFSFARNLLGFRSLGHTVKDKRKLRKMEEQMKILSEEFYKEVALFKKAMEYHVPSLDFLSKEEQLTYLYSTVNPGVHKVNKSRDSFLGNYLCNTQLSAGRYPKLGNFYIGTISIMDFPEQSQAFILEQLNNIKSEYRWVTRYIAIGKNEALKEMNDQTSEWKQSAFSLDSSTPLLKFFSPDDVDVNAVIQTGDSIDVYENLAQDSVGLGHYTMTFTLLNLDQDTLQKDIEKVVATMNNLGFIAHHEKFNAVHSFFGSIPGCYSYNIRKSLITSLNLIFTLPTASKWVGDQKNEFSHDRALYQCVTEENTPFYVNLHMDDMGHFLLIGGTGTGKSVKLNVLAANFTKYKNSKVFILDKSASSRVVTKAMGGNFYHLLVDKNSISFQPFARVDMDAERQWASEWLIQFLEMQHEPLTSNEKNIIFQALISLGELSEEERTLSTFSTILQNPSLKKRLQILTKKGAYGFLFDSNVDRFGEGNWQAFEMEEVMDTPSILTPTLNYLLHRIEGQLDGVSPALIVLDESWLFLDNELFKGKIRQFFKDLRKKKCSVILATQNLSDIKEDMINVIAENCPTKVFLANPDAQKDTIKKLYENMGLNEREIEILTALTPKKEYFFTSPKGRRIIDLALTPVEIAFLAATSKTDQKQVEHLEHLDTIAFIREWLEYKNIVVGR